MVRGEKMTCLCFNWFPAKWEQVPQGMCLLSPLIKRSTSVWLWWPLNQRRNKNHIPDVTLGTFTLSGHQCPVEIWFMVILSSRVCISDWHAFCCSFSNSTKTHLAILWFPIFFRSYCTAILAIGKLKFDDRCPLLDTHYKFRHVQILNIISAANYSTSIFC